MKVVKFSLNQIKEVKLDRRLTSNLVKGQRVKLVFKHYCGEESLGVFEVVSLRVFKKFVRVRLKKEGRRRRV
jgi:hypothetical protein